MPSTYTTNLGIEKIATGEQSGTWGTTTNTNFDLIDTAVNGIVSITLASAGTSGSPNDLPINDGTASDGRNKFIEFVDGGDLGATAYVQLTPNDAEKIVHIRNSLSGSRSIIVFQGTYNASNDFEIPSGADVTLKFDGAGTGATVTDVNVDLTVTGLTATSTVSFSGATIDNLGTVTTADINGGTIDGTVIGGSSAAAGTFTNLTASGTVSFSGATVSNGGTVTTVDINGGTIDGTVIGGSSAAAGTFTTFTSTGIDDNATSTAITIDSSQNVGIGTASPSSQNSVFKEVIGSSSDTNSGSVLVSSSVGSGWLGWNDSESASIPAYIKYDHATDSMQFQANSSERMRIDSSGNVGIGETAPSRALDIKSANPLNINTTSNNHIHFQVNDVTTGQYASSSSLPHQLCDSTGSSPRLVVDSSGNVGIGTSSPSQKLEIDIDGTSQTAKATGGGQLCIAQQGISSLNSSGGIELKTSTFENGYGAKIVAFDNGDLVFGLRNNSATFVERLRIDRESGNVGIGTSSPDAKLDVKASTATVEVAARFRKGSTADTGGHTMLIGLGTEDATWSKSAIGHQRNSQYDVGDLIFCLNNDSGSGSDVSTSDERMRITSSGNVGIGTSSPFSVGGYTVLDIGSATTSPLINLTDDGTDSGRLVAQDNEVHLSSGTASGYLTFRTGGFGSANERMRIDSSGNLLVGTTSSSTTSGEGSKFLSNGRLFQVSSYSTSVQESLAMYSTGAGAYRFYVDWGGTVHATSTSISAISDQRLKENIRDLDVGLDAVLALKPRKFDWKEGKGKNVKNDRGFIAQEFEEIFPDLIDERKDPAPEGEEPYKSVRQDLIPVLVKAIQEQQAMIETLQAEVAALKGA